MANRDARGPTADVNVVGICGSLRDASKTRVAMGVALEAARDAGAETELVDLREYDLPPRDGDDRDAGDAAAIRAAVRRADGLVLGTPVYHGTIASPLKTALDYCHPDDFAGTTVGPLAVAGGGMLSPTLEHLRTVARTVRAWTVPTQVGIRRASDVIRDGAVTDPEVETRLQELGTQLARYAGVERYPELPEAPADPLVSD